MRGSIVQSLVKNGTQTPLDSKAFACYATQMFCQKSDSALLSSCYGAELGGLAFRVVHN